MCLDLLKPVLDIVKGTLLSAIVHKDYTHSALIVSLCDCSETLLTCCIPHLQFYPLVLYINRLDLEINSCKLKKEILGVIIHNSIVSTDMSYLHILECIGQ